MSIRQDFVRHCWCLPADLMYYLFCRHEKNTALKNIYFIYSFGFLIMRTVFVSLFAASINDESKNIKKELYSVSSHNYCEEVIMSHATFLVQGVLFTLFNLICRSIDL